LAETERKKASEERDPWVFGQNWIVQREKENATKAGQASPARAEAVVMASSPAPQQTIVFCDAHSEDEHAIDSLC
jgi:hypothetical protein